jgi:hypothetical protein
MKIDNILNKEKSPDKATIAERTASIEDIKKSQKFYDFNDLSSATNINNNLLQEQEALYDYLPPTTSKLKKLLLHNDPEANNLNIHNNNNSGKSVVNCATTKNNSISVKSNSSSSNNKRNNNGATVKKSVKNANKQKLFLCSECNEYFLKLHLFNHIKSVHNKFTCLYCYGFFADVESLEKHLVKKHKVQNTSFFDEASLQNFLNPGTVAPASMTKSVKAVCCKCATIFSITDANFHNHSCGVEEEKALEVPVMAPIELPIENSHSPPPQNNLHLSAAPPATLDPAKEDFYCDQAIQQWCQPSFRPDEALQPEPAAMEQYQHHETSSQYQNAPVVEKVEEKLVVPKLTLKIPKGFQQQTYDNVESEEDSGDEGSSSDEDNERCESKLSTANDFPGNNSSSLSDTDNEVNTPEPEPEKKPENMPSLKLKIKNLASNNPESVLENFDFPQPSVTDDSKSFEESGEPNDVVDMTECPMDLEPTKEEEVEEPTKLIVIDGVVITPANEDVFTLDISLDEALDKIAIVKFMKICLKASIPYCLFCNHARKIVVNGKALAIHFIKNHRFHAMVDSITEEELHPEKIVSKLESSMEELNACLFNLETFDNQDEEKKEGHVTISHDKLYECFQCRFQTPIHKELYLHNRKMHQKSLINCLMCKMSFYSYSELLCHICPGVVNSKQMFLDYKFYCCLCNLDNIPSAFRLMVHLRKKHYACDVCLEKCSDQGKLSSHVWKHKLFHLCYRCNICYRNKADIMKHLFWKHGTEGIECKKCLQKKWPHVYHFCIPPAAFTCQHCEMSFSRAMALNVHMRLHEDGAKYACTEIGCEKKFVSRKLLLRHLDRHQHEITEREGENAGQERSEGIVMIPADIPEGCCTRTMPVVFKRFTKRPAIRKMEDEVKAEVKPEQEAKKEEKTLPDLPETNLNLSESSDSDSSDDEQSAANQRSIETLAALVEAQIDNEPETSEETKPTATKISSLSDSDEDEESQGVKKEDESKDVAMKDISNNLKNEESNEKVKTEEVPVKAEVKEKEPEEVEDKLPDKMVLHVCQSDHDYANLYAPPSGSTKEDLEALSKTAKIEKAKKKLAKAEAKKNKVKKVSDPNNDFSSSSGSSGSSSSSSGSSSGSSSSSSGSSSDSSSSEASPTNPKNLNKPRNKKFSKKRAKKEKKAKKEVEEAEVPRDPDDIICESDLVTDETDTDEDFYDEHPLKLDNILAEKRKQLLKGGVIDGIVENSRPSTPSLPPDEKIEKKMKKKRKKEHRKSSSPSKRPHHDSTSIVNPGDASMNSYFNNSLFSNPPETPHINKLSYFHHQTSTPISSKPQIELHQANQIRQLLQSTQQQPVLPILKEQHHYHSQMSNDYVNVSHVPSMASSAASTQQNSDSEAAIKRSQRKRIPNKFYGYTSDDESMAAQMAANITSDPFKPIPPPNLTWRKEDLPAKNKSPSNTPRIAPLKLNLGGDVLQQQLHTFAVEHKQAPSPQMYDYNYDPTPVASQTMPNILPQQNPMHQSDSDSSDDDQLHISEPRRRKRKLPSQANSMYAFHTLETPPTVAQPPIPRLKLTIGSNNKIRRRNINPLKVSAAKKRKLNNTAAKKNVIAPPPPVPVEARGTFNPYAKQYDLQPPTRLLQSPTFDQPFSQEATSSRQMLAQEKLDKQQRLEEAIMNTQQYFQRFNHTQVSSAEIALENADGDGRVYCYCRRPYDDLQGMIGCDGSACQIEWFHFECVGILVPPKGNWYCPECQKDQPAF